jgi:hypothetical protein
LNAEKHDPVSRKDRRAPFAPVTPAVEEWRRTNPLRQWLDRQPYGTPIRLARELGVNSKTIYVWTAGKSLPPADVLLKLCDKIHVGFRDYIRWWNDHPGHGQP